MTEYTLKGLYALYYAITDKDQIEYFKNSDRTVITENITFYNIEDYISNIDINNVFYSQTRSIDQRGFFFSKTIDITIPNKHGETIEQLKAEFQNKKIVFFFLDNNSNWMIAGNEKPFQLNKIELSNSKDKNEIVFQFLQNSPEPFQVLRKDFVADSTASFPNVNIPSALNLSTSLSSILLSWVNPVYSIDVKSFKIKKVDPNNNISYIVIPNSSNTNTYTDLNIGGVIGNYTYSVAASENVDGSLAEKYCPSANITISDYNIVQGLSSTVPTNTNNIRLTWTNRSPYTITVQSYQILRTNPSGHPSGATNTFTVNSSSLTGYTDTNVGINEGTYAYQVRVCAATNGGTPSTYSNARNQAITNYNVPQGLSTSVSGNNITLTWTNRSYTSTVQSFAISRTQDLGGGNWGNNQLLYLNNNGTATSFTDVNVGAISAGTNTFRYQIAIATGLNGANRQTFTNLVSQAITNVNTPPTFELTGVYNITKYYGRYIIQPQLRVIGGSGTVTVYWKNKLTGFSAFDNQQSQSIVCNGTTFTTYINSYQYDRSFSGDRTWTVQLDTNSNYTIGGGNTSISQFLPRRKSTPFSSFTAVKSSGNVVMNWSQVVDTGTTTIYGYVVNRYDTSNFTQNPIAWISGITTLTYTDTAVPNGNWSYYVRPASVNGQDTSPFCGDASSIVSLVIP